MKVIKCLKNIPGYTKDSVFMDNRKEGDDIYFNGYKLSFLDCNWIDYIIDNCNDGIFEIKEE